MPIQIVSTGSYMPEKVVTNDDLAQFLDTSDEWISTRSGIRTRHITTTETTSDFGIEAGRKALERSRLAPSDIELLICASTTPDTCVPACTSLILKGLGIDHAVTFDLNANCSGFLYGMVVAESMMKNCGYEHALVIGSETNSQLVDWSHRSTCVLFGDGAGAAVLSKSDRSGMISSYLNCIPDDEELLLCYNRIDPTPFSEFQRVDNVKISMQGKKVMRFAIDALMKAVDIVTEESGISLDKIKYIVSHQANLKILHFAAKRMKLSLDRFYVTIDHTANTSAASIPIALDEMVTKGLIQRGDLLLFVAFGGGLTSGAVLIEW